MSRRSVLAALLFVLLPLSAFAQARASVLRTGTLTSTTATADQVVLTYTVSASKTLLLNYVTVEGSLTVPSATAAALGTVSLETPAGTKSATFRFLNSTTSAPDRVDILIPEGTFTAGQVVRVVVTPAGTTSTVWNASLGGSER